VGLTGFVPEPSSNSFFHSGECTGENTDEDLDDRQVGIRAKVLLATEDLYPDQWVTLIRHSGRTFDVPVTVARHCGFVEAS